MLRQSLLRDTPSAPAGPTRTSAERLEFPIGAPVVSAASRHVWQILPDREAILPPDRRRFEVSKSTRQDAPLASGLPVLLVRLASEEAKFPGKRANVKKLRLSFGLSSTRHVRE